MLKTAKIIGLNSDTDAAITLVAEQPLNSFGAKPQKLHLFIIISASLEDAFTRTRQALSEAENIFYSSELAIADRVSETEKSIKNSLQDSSQLNILFAATQEEVADTFFYFLGQSGNLEAHLVREGKRTDLCELSEGQVISGIIKDGDRIMMATKTLDKILQDNLQGLEKIGIEMLEDEIASKLPEAENYPVAAIVVEKEKVVLPEVGTAKEEIVEQLSGPSQESGVKTKAFFKAATNWVKARITGLIPRSKRALALIGVVLLVLVLISVGVGYKNKKSEEQASTRNNYLQEATDEYNKAQSLKDSDTKEAINSLNKAKVSLDQIDKFDPNNREAKELKNRIEESLPDITKIYPVNDFPVWLDLDLIKKGFSAQALSLSAGDLLILDPEKKNLVNINLLNKSQNPLAGLDKIGEALFASINGDVAMVFSKDKGVLRVDTTNAKLTVVAKPDTGVGVIKDLFAFAGNVYLLDSTKNQIWKYLPIQNGYSDKREYLKTSTNLIDANKLQIDSSVWILRKNLEILKFTQGVADNFAYAGLDKSIKEISSFFVSSDTENIYIIDKGNNRLLVLDKTGNYKSEYSSDKFSTFTDLVVDEAKKQVYLLGGSKIFSMDLK